MTSNSPLHITFAIDILGTPGIGVADRLQRDGA